MAEERLRDVFRATTLPDNGFTERVMAAIPVRRRPVLAFPSALALAWTVSAGGIATALYLSGSGRAGFDIAASLSHAAAFLVANPWITFAAATAFVFYLTGLLTARAAIDYWSRPR